LLIKNPLEKLGVQKCEKDSPPWDFQDFREGGGWVASSSSGVEGDRLSGILLFACNLLVWLSIQLLFVVGVRCGQRTIVQRICGMAGSVKETTCRMTRIVVTLVLSKANKVELGWSYDCLSYSL